MGALVLWLAHDQGLLGARGFRLAWFLLVSPWGVATFFFEARFYYAYRVAVTAGFGDSASRFMAPLDEASATLVARILGPLLALGLFIRFLVALAQP